MREVPKAFEKYRHFKGNVYQILNLAKDSETMEDVVVYQALYGDYQIYVRPLSMFMSEVDRDKYPDVEMKFRFEKIDAIAAPAKADAVVQANMQEEGNEEASGAIEYDVQIEETENVTESVHEKTDESVKEPVGELAIEPAVLEFLEADTYGQKLNILASLKHRITDDMITTMAMASDLEVEEGPVEIRYEQLKNCLLTKEKYECIRVR